MGLFGKILGFFGGPSSAETNAAGNVSNLAATIGQHAETNWGRQSALFNNITGVINPIIAAGPSQMGYSPEELAALRTAAMNSTAGNYANAERSVGTKLAGEGGGTFAGPKSGVAGQIEGSLAGEAANQLSGEQLGITKSNWDTGRENYLNALNEGNALAEMENPLPGESAAMAGQQESFGDQKDIAAQKSAALGGLLSTGLSLINPIKAGIGNLDTTGSSNPLEQMGNFFSGFTGGGNS